MGESLVEKKKKKGNLTRNERRMRKRGERVCEAKERREGLWERNKRNGLFLKILYQQMMLTLATSPYSVEVKRICYKVKHESFKYHKQNYNGPVFELLRACNMNDDCNYWD